MSKCYCICFLYMLTSNLVKNMHLLFRDEYAHIISSKIIYGTFN